MNTENTNFGTATNKQRWALFCLTKKDYRQVNISKEDASELIANYKEGKNGDSSPKTSQNKTYNPQKYIEVSNEDLRAEFAKIWGKDARMVEWCIKNHSTNIRLSSGKIICFDKPTIQTDFWVGYGHGAGREYEEADKLKNNIYRNMEEYFIDKNMTGFNSQLKQCEDSDYNIYIAKQYDSKEENNFVNFYLIKYECGFDFERLQKFAKDFQKVTNEDDIALIKWAIREDANKFKKRLITYLKRFGTSKLRCQTYWADR